MALSLVSGVVGSIFTYVYLIPQEVYTSSYFMKYFSEREVSVSDTANILIALINGLIRQQVYKPDDFSGIRESAVSFCRWSLVKNEAGRMEADEVLT